MSLNSLVDGFLLHCAVERRLSRNTVSAYRYDLAHFMRFVELREDASELCLERAADYLRFLLEIEACSVSTARRRIVCLRRFSSYRSEALCIDDPLARWSPKLRKPKRLPRSISREEVASLVDAGRNARDDDLVFSLLIISATGLRISEFCSICASDISPDGAAIRIFGKGARERMVYLSNIKLNKALARRRRAAIERGGPNAPLITNARGGPISPQVFRRRLHAIRARSDVSRSITPHMLRHTAATLLIENGTDIRFVQRLLGHASISTTEIYTHVSDQSLRQAIKRADALAFLD